MLKIQQVNDFIKRAQSRDEKTKKKYLVIASSVSMVIVIFLWILYLNTSVPAVTDNTASSTAAETSTFNYLPQPSQNENQNSFFQTLGRGFAEIKDSTGNSFTGAVGSLKNWWTGTINQIKNEFRKTNNLNLENPGTSTESTSEETTTLGAPEAIPPTPLP